MNQLEVGSAACNRDPGGWQVEPDPAALEELSGNLARHRDRLVEEWGRRIADGRLLSGLPRPELLRTARVAFDGYLESLRATPGAVAAFARSLVARLLSRGVEIQEVMEVVLLLHDVLFRQLLASAGGELAHLRRVADAWEPAANRIAYAVAIALLEERERLIREQQEAIRELLDVAAALQGGATSPMDSPPFDGVEREA